MFQATDRVRKQFTGYERDAETDLDFAQARLFSSALGRFTSPDPFGGSGFVQVPQSWNRYSYCLNRPMLFTDPTGLIFLTNDGGKNYIWVDDKVYKKDPNKYSDYQVGNGAVIRLAYATGFDRNYNNLVGSLVTLNANGTITAARDVTVQVYSDDEDEDRTITVFLGGVQHEFAPELYGPPGGNQRFNGGVRRWYNSDGRAYVDVHHHDGEEAGNPHVHWWDWETGQTPKKGKAQPLPEWFGDEGMDDDGMPVLSPFPRAPLARPGLVPIPAGRPFPAGQPIPVPIRPGVPLRLPFPILRPVMP